MYQQAAINLLPSPQERITIKSYLDCAKCVYMFYGIFQILGAVGILAQGGIVAVGNIIFAVVYFVGISKCSETQRQLSQPNFDYIRVKGNLEYTFCVNIVVSVFIFIGVGGLVLLLVMYIIESLRSNASGNFLIVIIIAFVVIVFWGTPFFMLIAKHKEVKGALNLLGAVNNPLGAAGIYNQALPGQNNAYFPPQPATGFNQQPQQGYNNSLGNGGFGGNQAQPAYGAPAQGGYQAPPQQGQPDYGNFDTPF